MEKILFIVPPHVSFQDFIHPLYNARIVAKKNGDFGNILTEMPLGALSLSSYIKSKTAVLTKLIDFNVELNEAESFEHKSFAEFFEECLSKDVYRDFCPNIIGISCLFTPSYENMINLAKVCRRLFPDALITAGGGVPTNMYKEIFAKTGDFDALCYGEGEKPLLGLVTAEDKTAYLEKDASWITPQKEKNGSEYVHNFIIDLDEIPFYDYDLCETYKYGRNPALTAYASIKNRSNNFHVMTSRGCTHRCCFCSSHTVHGRAMRYYSIKRIKEDFTRLKDKYGAEIFVFQDDHLMADKKRVYEILGIIKELGVKAVFQNGLALYALDRKMIENLKAAGADQLLLSIESGSERVLKEVMHKPLNLSIVRQVVKDCRELGIYANVNILIGLPGETKKDIEDTRKFLKTANANWYLIFCANPLVGSEMYEICKDKNYFKGNVVGSDYKRAVVETEEFTAAFIQEKAYDLNIELNFFENSDYKLGEYKTALNGFENAIKAKNDHAPAYFMASKCYEKIGDHEKAREYMAKAMEIIDKDQFWRYFFEKFNVSISAKGDIL